MRRKKSKGNYIRKDQKKIYYKKNIKSNLSEAGYMLINKKKFFSNIIKKKTNKDLPDYLNFLSKKFNLYGINYKKNFFCIENQSLINRTKIYFKKNY